MWDQAPPITCEKTSILGHYYVARMFSVFFFVTETSCSDHTLMEKL